MLEPILTDIKLPKDLDLTFGLELFCNFNSGAAVIFTHNDLFWFLQAHVENLNDFLSKRVCFLGNSLQFLLHTQPLMKKEGQRIRMVDFASNLIMAEADSELKQPTLQQAQLYIRELAQRTVELASEQVWTQECRKMTRALAAFHSSGANKAVDTLSVISFPFSIAANQLVQIPCIINGFASSDFLKVTYEEESDFFTFRIREEFIGEAGNSIAPQPFEQVFNALVIPALPLSSVCEGSKVLHVVNFKSEYKKANPIRLDILPSAHKAILERCRIVSPPAKEIINVVKLLVTSNSDEQHEIFDSVSVISEISTYSEDEKEEELFYPPPPPQKLPQRSTVSKAAGPPVNLLNLSKTGTKNIAEDSANQ